MVYCSEIFGVILYNNKNRNWALPWYICDLPGHARSPVLGKLLAFGWHVVQKSLIGRRDPYVDPELQNFRNHARNLALGCELSN